MDDADLLTCLGIALFEHHASVELGDGHREFGGAHFFTEHSALHGQIVCMGREAEWNTGEPLDDECRNCRMIRKVCVHVIDALPLHLTRKKYGLRQNAQCPNEEIPASPCAAKHLEPRSEIRGRSAPDE